MSLNDMTMKTGQVEYYLYQDDTTSALKALGEIIQELMSKNNYVVDKQLKDMLIMSCIKRININFKEKKYRDVITDIKILNSIKYDIYTDQSTFLMYLESIASLSQEMAAVKENVGALFNTTLMFSKEVQKPVKTKK
ncbi:unnamed protein product [Rotaria sp. Silwood1]|nr:unnamed protein product [Rotaria sp. Silwood1]CAF1656451.1 unnamed protein product [Rotaria sp. Silwood1]